MPKTLYKAEDLAHIQSDRIHELDEGRLVPLNIPRTRHGYTCSTVNYEMSAWAKRTGLGQVLCNDAGYVLQRDPDTVRGPDVSFVRAECWDPENDWYIESYPDLAVEVLSPDDKPKNVRRKIEQYLRAGCPLVWVIDERKQRVQVIRKESTTILGMQDVLDGEDVCPGLRLEVSALFLPETKRKK